MRKRVLFVLATPLLVMFLAVPSYGTNLTLESDGRVVVELVTSYAAFHNTLSLASPNAAIVTTGCDIEVVTGFSGLELLSEKTSQRGCRVELDADPVMAGIQEFVAGEILEFRMCAQTDADPACEYVWSSNSADNSDSWDHLSTTELHSTDPDVKDRVYRLAWEDLPESSSDDDFNDLIVIVRIVQDSDGDGLWDDWEKFGIDTDGVGGVDFVLPGADPQHKDIYIEIDYMDCAVAGGDCGATDTHTHEPKAAAITEVVQAFANAPVANPDGVDGITLHVDVDDAIAHQDTFDLGCFGGADFDTIKNDPAFFGTANPRRFAYHYTVFAHQQTATTTSSGCAEVTGNDLIVTLGGWNYECNGGADNGDWCTPLDPTLCPGGSCDRLGDTDGDGTDDGDVGTIRQQAGTLMHELGHNLSLQHGGDECINYKPNYLSIMNYWFQFRGIVPAGLTEGPLDYSDTTLNSLDETNNNLNETVGINDGAVRTIYVCPDGSSRWGAGNGAIDWDCDGDGGTDTTVTANINGNCADVPGDIYPDDCGGCDPGEGDQLETLDSYDDWANIRYDFQNSVNFEDGVHLELDIPETDFRTYILDVNRPPVAVATVQATTVECTGPDGATIELDGSASYDPDGDDLTYTWDGPFGTLYGEIVNALIPQGTHTIMLTVMDDRGGSAVDTVEVTVNDTTPPDLSVTVIPEQLWPPNHKMATIAAVVLVSDTCDPAPTFQLVSIASNEPDEGLGDGDHPNDIQDAAYGTDDVRFSLRSERSGEGDGRTYSIYYEAQDASGNTSSVTEDVFVPLSQGK